MVIGFDENRVISTLRGNMIRINTYLSTIDKFVDDIQKDKLKPMAAADADAALVHVNLLKRELDEAEKILKTVSAWKKG